MPRALFRRLALLLHRNRFRSEMDEEMAFHREQAEKDLRAEGLNEENARYAAARQFGNLSRLREQSEQIVAFRIETIFQDLHFAFRQLRRKPGFALAAILILALGFGISVTIFGFVDAALLHPIPYPHPDRLVALYEVTAQLPNSGISRLDYEDWKRRNTTLSSLDVWAYSSHLLRQGETSERVSTALASSGFFHTLGVQPILGRDFLPSEDLPGAANVVMLTYATWQKRFGGRADVIGQSVNLSDDSYTIIGVLPSDSIFAPRGNGEFWMPLRGDECEKFRECRDLLGVGRLRNGVTVTQAEADLKRVAAQLEAQYPGSNRGQSAGAQLLSESFIGDYRPILLTLLGGAGLLLLIACVNVASLLLVRSESRRREMAVRGALGATRLRLLRQFVTEGALLAVAGCAFGTAFASVAMPVLAKQVPTQMAGGMPFLHRVGFTAHTAFFASGIALLAFVLLSLMPALWLVGVNLRDGLSEGGNSAAGRLWRRMGANLVVVELMVAVTLLAGAGLLVKSFYRLLHVDPGFDTSHLATVMIQAPGSRYVNNQQTMVLFHEIEQRLSALPGVVSVGLTSDLPIQCNCNTDRIRIPGRPYNGEHNEIVRREVSPGYMATLRTRLLRGRMITEADDLPGPMAVVINESMARKYFPGEDPIGKKLGDLVLSPDSLREVVGVIADVHESGLDEDIWPAEYSSIHRVADTGFAVAVRTADEEKTILPEIVRTLHQIDPSLGVFHEMTMQEWIATKPTVVLHRASAWLIGGFAVMSLVLSIVGLYSVIAYAVSQRRREIGVRMALGATRRSVYVLVMKQSIVLAATGLVLGLVCVGVVSMLLRKLLAHVLFSVSARDTPTLIAVVLVLGVAAVIAGFLPARRAASVNPSEALRAD
jgi:predicted permease